MKNKRSNLFSKKIINLHIMKVLINFMIVLMGYGCVDKANKELNQLYKIHPYLRSSSWNESYREHYSDYDIVILRRINADTNIYLHYTNFASKTKNGIKFSNVFTRIEYYDSVYFHELQIKSGVDTLYHFMYPKECVDFNNPVFRRDTLNLSFVKGKDYYFDRNNLKPRMERAREWNKKQGTTLPAELEPLHEVR